VTRAGLTRRRALRRSRWSVWSSYSRPLRTSWLGFPSLFLSSTRRSMACHSPVVRFLDQATPLGPALCFWKSFLNWSSLF